MKVYLFALLVVMIVVAACSKGADDAIDIPELEPQPTFTHKITGDTTNVNTQTLGGTCLMGGGSDVDEAFKWMIAQSGGGDFVVIRCDESFGYNSYIYRMKGVNSVETIVIATAADANTAAVAAKIRNAEALFIAGGDQKRYVSLWKNSPVEDAINYLIHTKHAPVGGTSAGCAIMGASYFAALKGTVTSAQALANPFNALVTLGHNDFIDNPLLQNTITDQHYSQRGREGRLVAFMARMHNELSISPRAIAVDEETAVCINNNGIATVFGANSAFFLQPSAFYPETCIADTPLTWNRSLQAIKVYRIAGSSAGNGAFSLIDYTTAEGGDWLFYAVDNGRFVTN